MSCAMLCLGSLMSRICRVYCHSVLTGCVIIFEMTVTPSLFIKSSIYNCMIVIMFAPCQWRTIYQKEFTSNPLVLKLTREPHSVLTGCVIIFQMTVTPSLFIKSSIFTCRTDIRQMINHLHQKNLGLIDPLRSYMKRIFELLKS